MRLPDSDEFLPPGDGQWSVDPTHFPRPVTALLVHMQEGGARRGQRVGAARYGLLTVGGTRAAVHGFHYARPDLLVGYPPGEDPATARRRFEARLEADPFLQEYLARAEHALASEQWEADLDRWDTVVKPGLRGRQVGLAAVDPAALGVEGLAAHFEDCREHAVTGTYFHHVMNPLTSLATGEFQLRCAEWAGSGQAEVALLLRGYSPGSSGADPELSDAAREISRDAAAACLLDGPDSSAQARLDELRRLDGAAGEAVRQLVAVAGYRTSAGFDPMDLYAIEMPAAFLGRVRAAAEGRTPPGPDEATEERTRERVPAANRDEFDRLLARARRFVRVKDERGLYANLPAYGLLRRAVLEVGRRAAGDGYVADAADMADATLAEIRSFLRGEAPVRPEVLAERRCYRTSHTIREVPATLGTPHELPIPPAWLPGPAAALSTFLAAARESLLGAAAVSFESGAVWGAGASPGRYRGRARVVLGPADFAKVEPGDVLVASGTNPAFSMMLALVGAVVTDSGGVMSHAAIVAREFGVPAVVGCGNATEMIADGALVEVDADEGVVRLV